MDRGLKKITNTQNLRLVIHLISRGCLCMVRKRTRDKITIVGATDNGCVAHVPYIVRVRPPREIVDGRGTEAFQRSDSFG